MWWANKLVLPANAELDAPRLDGCTVREVTLAEGCDPIWLVTPGLKAEVPLALMAAINCFKRSMLTFSCLFMSSILFACLYTRHSAFSPSDLTFLEVITSTESWGRIARE